MTRYKRQCPHLGTRTLGTWLTDTSKNNLALQVANSLGALLQAVLTLCTTVLDLLRTVSMKVSHLAIRMTSVSGGHTETQKLANSGYSTTVSSINFRVVNKTVIIIC